MGTTSKGWAEKGSKYWMQASVYYEDWQDELNKLICGSDLNWISPVAGEENTFAEYSLNQKCNVLSEIGIPKDENNWKFWPKRQPQWDGIAVSKNGKILYLVEAKAHYSEIRSSLRSKLPENKNLIRRTLKNAYDKYKANGDFCCWTDKYYQLANRLAFLNELNNELNNKVPFGKIEKVELILLNFTNDHTYISEKKEKWEKHYKKIWENMLGVGVKEAPKDVKVVYFDCRNKEKRNSGL